MTKQETKEKAEKKELAKVREVSKEISTAENILPMLSVETIKSYFCPKATDQELVFALKYCQENNLNPWKKEVYFVKFGEEPYQYITSYRIALKRAEDNPNYDGYEISFSGSAYGNEPDLQATCTVYRKDRKFPVVHTAYYSENVNTTKDGKPNKFWKIRPRFMLEKCAIAQALQLAFPKDVGDILIGEIPEQYEENNFNENYSPSPKVITDVEGWLDEDSPKPIEGNDRKRFWAHARELNLEKEEIKKMLIERGFIKESTKELNTSNFNAAYRALDELVKQYEEDALLNSREGEEEAPF